MRFQWIVGLLCIASSAVAQRPDTTSKPFALWGSLTLGPGIASNRDGARIGAQAAVFGAYDKWVAAVRRGGASGIESGGAYDDALLIGRRYLTDYSTILWAVGPAIIYDESEGVPRGGLGFTVHASTNVHVVGVGATVFGGGSPHLGYIGIGLTLNLGWIQ